MRNLYYSLAFGLTLLLAGCDKGGSDPQPTTTQPKPGPATPPPASQTGGLQLTCEVTRDAPYTSNAGVIARTTPFAKSTLVNVGYSFFPMRFDGDLKSKYSDFKKGDKVYVSVFYARVNNGDFVMPASTQAVKAKVYKQYIDDPVASVQVTGADFKKADHTFTDTNGIKYVYSETEIAW